MAKNVILRTDSYKLNHWPMYPKGTQQVYSYFESRRGAKFPYTAFFGLQPIVQNNLVGKVVLPSHIEEAAALCKAHFGSEEKFNRRGWEYILGVHNGKLPLAIRAVPEGTLVPTENVMMTVTNTDKQYPEPAYWLTNQLESLLTHVWYPSTVATLSHAVKGIIRKYLNQTSDNLKGLDFMLHDFGYRGVSSDESAEIGGAAHLINFLGTDTVPAILFLAENYSEIVGVPEGNKFDGIAYSVPATEHSIMTALGLDGEDQVVDNLLTTYPTGILSVVADSRNIYRFVEEIMGITFKERILTRDGVFVVRPDSVTDLHPTPEAEMVWIVAKLYDLFGGVINSKGFKVINPKVRVLWGDGIDIEGIEKILKALMEAGFAAENVATFGMGGGLLQKVNRDTQRFAFKSSYQVRNGVGYDIWKQPLDASKASKKGRLKLVVQEAAHANTLVTVPESDPRPDVMKVVFQDGELVTRYSLSEVRKNASVVWPPYS